ncbi:ATP-binding protein [Candidatus Peregrinibacteria bacterium]|nr:MAG: ATP-binding protein [Candidatus Peregrinibacteria bacterium]
MQTIHIRLPASLTYSAFLRHLSNDLFVLAGFNAGWCGRLKMVVDELFMNAVRYGSNEQSDVYLHFAYDDTNFTFTIEDEGKGAHPLSVQALRDLVEANSRDGNLSRTSGRGLAMITKWWTDSMALNASDYGGISVQFTKTIDNTEPAVGLPIAGSIVPDFVIGEPVTPGGNRLVVRLSGAIDASNVTEKIAPVVEQLDALNEGEILVVDCQDVSYISSVFVGHLASWQTTTKRKKAQLHLRGLQPAVSEVLQLVGLLKLLTIES